MLAWWFFIIKVFEGEQQELLVIMKKQIIYRCLIMIKLKKLIN